MGLGSRTKVADTNRPQEYKNRATWKPRPWLGRSIRVAIALVPIVPAFAVTMVLGRIFFHPDWSLLIRVFWGLGMFVVGSVVGTAVGRWVSRLVPLSSLCQMNLAFPEEAPSRLKMALRVGNSGNAQAVLEDFRAGRLAADPQVAAEQVLTLVEILNNHDRRTRGHSERVRALSDVIAEELCLSDKDRGLLRWASLLHDIGKLAVPSEILNKKGKPTEEEWKVLQGHPAAGHSRIAPLKDWLGDWALCIEQHHERFDGTGYPLRLNGAQMPIGSRIVAVADAFEVMTAARSYKKPMSYDDARAELARCAGTHFDPKVVRAFLNVGYKDSRISKGFLSSVTGELAAGNGAAAKIATRLIESSINSSPAALLGASAAKAGVVAAALSVASASGVPIVSFDDGLSETVLADDAATVVSTTVPTTLGDPTSTTIVVSVSSLPPELALVDETVPPQPEPSVAALPTTASPQTSLPASAPTPSAPPTTVGLVADNPVSSTSPAVQTVAPNPTNPSSGVGGGSPSGRSSTTAAPSVATTASPGRATTTRTVTTRVPATVVTTVPPTTAPTVPTTLPDPTSTTAAPLVTPPVNSPTLPSTLRPTVAPTSPPTLPTTLPSTTVPETVGTLPPTPIPTTTAATTSTSTTTLAITTLPITTLAITTLPITTLAITTLAVTTLAVTTLAITTLPITTLPVTTLAVTTLAVTTLPITTTLPTTTTTTVPATTSTTTLPTTTSTTTTTIPPAPSCSLWEVAYFSNSGLVGPPTPDQGGCLATVNGYWGSASPSALITGDAFSARYTRQVTAGTYTLTVRADDGFRVKVDGTTVSDHWGSSGSIGTPLVIPMTLAVTSEVSLEYQELGGLAVFDVDLTGGVPFLTTNNPIAATSGMNALGAWNLDTFAAPGKPPISGSPANSMNLGLIEPTAVSVNANEVYVADAFGTLTILNRDGTFIRRVPLPLGVKAMDFVSGTFVGVATQCTVGLVGTVTGAPVMQPTQCGTGVAPGTYLAAGMVFEGSIQDIVSDNGDLYILDQKYVWKTNALMTLFTAVIGTQANLGAAVDGTDGLSYTLSTPLSLAKRNNVMVIGEVNRVLRFDTTGTNTFDGSLLIGSSPVPGDPLTTLQATDTTVAHVSALAFYDDDTVLVAEQYRDIVRYISLSAMTVTPIAGKEWVDAPPYLDSANTPISSTSARLFDPVDIVVGNNAVYVAQGGYGLIHRLN